jgi:MoxR-like ATPase
VQAVKQGRWVLIEDIDLAPIDVISMLVPLLETNTLFVPGRGEEHRAAPGFQLFATRRSAGGAGRSETSALLDGLFAQVPMVPLSSDELDEVLRARYPTVSAVVPRLLAVYHALDAAALHDTTPRAARFLAANPPTARDLLKWAARVVMRANAAGADQHDEGGLRLTLESVFAEGLDCFCAAAADPEVRLALALEVGNHLDVPPDQVRYHLEQYKPRLQLSAERVDMGRASIPVHPRHGGHDVDAVFAQTRHALCLLECVTAAVEGAEPVLLVGETGTGKTTVVQHLARLAGRKLVVVNMSQQSDAADLLGGFRPVDVQVGLTVFTGARALSSPLLAFCFHRSFCVRFALLSYRISLERQILASLLLHNALVHVVACHEAHSHCHFVSHAFLLPPFFLCTICTFILSYLVRTADPCLLIAPQCPSACGGLSRGTQSCSTLFLALGTLLDTLHYAGVILAYIVFSYTCRSWQSPRSNSLKNCSSRRSHGSDQLSLWRPCGKHTRASSGHYCSKHWVLCAIVSRRASRKSGHRSQPRANQLSVPDGQDSVCWLIALVPRCGKPKRALPFRLSKAFS